MRLKDHGVLRKKSYRSLVEEKYSLQYFDLRAQFVVFIVFATQGNVYSPQTYGGQCMFLLARNNPQFYVQRRPILSSLSSFSIFFFVSFKQHFFQGN